MASAEVEGLKAEIERLRKENAAQQEQIKHRDAIITAYRRWYEEAPFLNRK
jgi:hypothetical protein